METLINPKQILGAGTKILNVVQIGTLNRDGAVFSGFSNSNYLQLGARVDKGILSLDSSTYYKNCNNISDSIELIVKIKTGSNLTPFQNIIGWDDTIDLYIENSYLKIWNASQNIALVGWELSQNSIYWIKVNINGTFKTLSYSTDGITYSNVSTEDTTLEKYSICRIGNGVSNSLTRPFLGSIDINETYIKSNGEYWWKGVETI